MSCSKDHLKLVLQGKLNLRWNEEEDHILKYRDTIEFNNIVKEKGKAEVERRIKYLGLDESTKIN